MLMSIPALFIIGSGSFLAFSNGANDNFKGVATLFGSRTTTYKVALVWATIATLAGSVAAFFLAQKLMSHFSGKGLVPDQIMQMGSFSASVALAAALTVFLATRLGFPISTTHALTGALVGVGFIASPSGVNVGRLFGGFLLPLFVSPLISILGAVVLYPVLSRLRAVAKVSRESCLCVGSEAEAVSSGGIAQGAATVAAMAPVVDFAVNIGANIGANIWPRISVGTQTSCKDLYVGRFFGISAKKLLDSGHFLSSGLVSFARGLNDTPKIAAVLLVGGLVPAMPAIAMTGLVIALGGILMAKKIANTMAFQITQMNDGQGFTANLVTSGIVIGASLLSLPVSTTHVSCGALFGIGAATHRANWHSITKIVMAWLVTLPLAGTLGYLSFVALRGFF